MIKANISLDIQQVLAPGGIISQSFPGFESRPQQVQMACHIQKAFVNCRHLVAEAGTGVGKSFAYLMPAIEVLARKKGKVLVSTFTITLQEQLINKDIPFLADCLPPATGRSGQGERTRIADPGHRNRLQPGCGQAYFQTV